MSVFFDTNVLLYCNDTSNIDKQARARHLVISASVNGEAHVSTQVLIELFNVLTRKRKTPAPIARQLVLHYADWPVVHSDLLLVKAAMQMTEQTGYSLWDAMVIEAALRCGAKTLYSEDLNHGQKINDLLVVNPFFPLVAKAT